MFDFSNVIINYFLTKKYLFLLIYYLGHNLMNIINFKHLLNFPFGSLLLNSLLLKESNDSHPVDNPAHLSKKNQ